ncbi:MAG: hypothetical protein IKB15_06935 [Alistipes sp.]|nr:hypothetical protein [Alistipes sp.]
MEKRGAIRIILCMVVIIFLSLPAMAQEDDMDYRHYKFYEEDMERYTMLYDDYLSTVPDAGAIPYIASNAEYAMRSVMNNPRGGSRYEERYMVGPISVDYTTSMMLMSLGIQRVRYPGLSNAMLSGTTTASAGHTLGETRAYIEEGHTLRGNFSGYNSLVGISYRAQHKISPHGVALDNDWHLSYHARARAGHDIYVDGVSNNAFDMSLYGSRAWGKNTLHLIAIVPYTRRGTRKASLDECFELANNTLYNPSWGMYKGRVRNANVMSELRPEVVVSWHRRVDDNTSVELTANVSYELYNYTTISNINAPSVLPDNYQRLPSYFTDEHSKREVTEAWHNDDLRYTQIDWDYLYHTNLLQSDGHAAYIIDKRHNNILRGTAAVDVEHRIHGITLHGGVIYDGTTSRIFKSVGDLLGAEHILNYDYFNADDSSYNPPPQNNLRDDDLRIYKGDHYGYDYYLTRHRAEIYGTVDIKYGRHIFAASLHVGSEHTRRRGLFEKEQFPERGSYGRSRGIALFPYRLNLGWSHRIGSHNITASAMVRGESPMADALFVQPNYNNRVIAQPRLSTALAAEVSYHYHTINFEAVATAFVTTHLGQTNVVRYYDDLAAAMVNGVMSDVATLNVGIEASARLRWTRSLRSSFMLTAAQYRYVRDAHIVGYDDNSNQMLYTSRTAIKGLHAPTPEITLYGDLEWYNTHGWWLRASVRYWGLRHVEPSFIRRSERITSHAPSSDEYDALMSQQRLDDAVLVDVVAGKNFTLSDRLSLRVQLSVNNLLGSNVVYRSYEQNRVHKLTTATHTHLSPFANMVQYAYSRTYALSVSLRF